MEKEYPSSYSPTYVSYLSSISLNDPPKKTCLATEELWQSKWRKASFFTLQVDIRIMNRCHAETTRRHTCTNYRTQQIRFLCPSISNTNDKHFTLGTKWRGGGKKTNPCLLDRELSPPRLSSGIEITQTNTDIHLATTLFFRQFELSEMLLLASKRRPAGLVPNGFVVLRWSSTMDNMFSALQ